MELQIRSNVQHSWATAVEVVGTCTRQALKASQGTDDWLNFFKLASIAFQDIEDRSIQKNVTTEERRELIKYIDDLDVINKLRAFAVSTNHLGKEKKNERGFFLLLLEIDKAKVKVMRFQSNEFDLATRKYAKLEVEYSNVVDRDVVLVSAESLWALKKAYPNYFADTAQFSKNLKKLLASDRRYIESVRSN